MTAPSIPPPANSGPPHHHDCAVLQRYGYQDRDTEQAAYLVEIAERGESRAAWDLYPLTTDLELIAEQAEDEGHPRLAAIIRHGAWVLDAATGMYGFAGRDDEWLRDEHGRLVQDGHGDDIPVNPPAREIAAANRRAHVAMVAAVEHAHRTRPRRHPRCCSAELDRPKGYVGVGAYWACTDTPALLLTGAERTGTR